MQSNKFIKDFLKESLTAGNVTDYIFMSERHKYKYQTKSCLSSKTHFYWRSGVFLECPN